MSSNDNKWFDKTRKYKLLRKNGRQEERKRPKIRKYDEKTP